MIIFDLREQYGDVFVSETPDGLIIPWKPLSIGDYFEYENRFAMNLMPPSILEDEIFKKCVTDKVLVDGIDRLKAGTVTTVVATIMQNSGPVSANDIEAGLNQGRARSRQIIHNLVTTICQAFPSYKPDELYDLDFSTFMLRLAQAEDRLLRAGVIKEPLSITSEEPEQVTPTPKAPEPEKKKPKVDLSKLKQEFDKQNWGPLVDTNKKPVASKPDKEVYGDMTKKTVITKADTDEHAAAIGGSAIDTTIDQNQMLKDTANIYKDYVDQQNKTGKLAIPPYEERMKAAQERANKNKERWDKYISKYDAQQTNAVEEANRIRKERQEKKNKKLKRKK